MVYIIGNGRVGEGLHLLDSSSKVFGRNDCISELKDIQEDDLVFICTRNDDLQSVIDILPTQALGNLVFVQNGMLSPFLKTLKPSPAARAILYFAVPKKGDKPAPGGDTIVCGEKASQVVNYFKTINIPAKAISNEEMAKVEMEKLLWNSVMGLLGQAYEETVEETLNKHWEEVEIIIDELLPAIQQDTGLVFRKNELLDSLKEYSKEVSYYSARVKEFKWRNQWFFDALKRQKIEAPHWHSLHSQLELI